MAEEKADSVNTRKTDTDLHVDRLVRSRRRTVSLIVETSGELVVRAPLHMSLKAIERIVAEKADWIRKHRLGMQQRAAGRPERRYEEGEPFLWTGRTLRLHLSEAELRVKREDGWLLVPDMPATERPAHILRWYREEARRILSERVRLWSALMGLTVDRVSITMAEKRWGSCGGRANLSFATRLVMAPMEVIDYVVVHELAHVTHKHHGPAFWEAVAAQVPDYGAHRRWLADHAAHMVF